MLRLGGLFWARDSRCPTPISMVTKADAHEAISCVASSHGGPQKQASSKIVRYWREEIWTGCLGCVEMESVCKHGILTGCTP